MRFLIAMLFAVTLGAALVACSDDDSSSSGACSVQEQTGCEQGLVCQEVAGEEPGCFCSLEAQTGCGDGLVCEEVRGSNTSCFAPVTLTGRVFDLATDEPLAGVRVLARDANNSAASGIVVTDATGSYELPVPAPRDEDGTPISHSVMLRADAVGYLTFPTAPRVALPIDLASATGDPLVVESAATDIGLVALETTTGLGAVSGKVVAEHPWGTLVVARGATGVADRDGSYAIFNVPAGEATVQGYKAGQQLQSASAEVTSGETTEGVDLHASDEATARVSGTVQIVNAPGGSLTTVILAVADTFDADAVRGEAPPGLRVTDVSGSFVIRDVPDGRYVVLAAFENDQLVRDPDTSIGGTSIVRVTVSGSDTSLSEGFKVTEGLEVISPDAEQVVGKTPMFVWRDDSGEDHYEVRVYDAFGALVWEKLDVPSVMGSDRVSVPYGGDPLESGSLYQFRATSIKRGGTPLSTTEDLRGVFVVE